MGLYLFDECLKLGVNLFDVLDPSHLHAVEERIAVLYKLFCAAAVFLKLPYDILTIFFKDIY